MATVKRKMKTKYKTFIKKILVYNVHGSYFKGVNMYLLYIWYQLHLDEVLILISQFNFQARILNFDECINTTSNENHFNTPVKLTRMFCQT